MRESTDEIIEVFPTGGKARLRAGELALAGALLFMAGVAWAHPEEVALASRYSLATVAVLFCTAALALARSSHPTLQLLREFLPVPVIPFVFLHLGLLIPLVHPGHYDEQLEALDRLLLGSELQAALYDLPLPWWLADLLTLAYSTFFFLPIVLLVALVRRRDPYLGRVASTIILTFLVSYAGYFVVPAYGPRAGVARERYVSLPPGIVGQPIRDLLDHWEKTKTDAFPSGHTMVTLAVLHCARKRLPRLYTALLPVGALLIAATVLLTYHWVVDVLAAIPLLLLSLALARWWCGPLPSVRHQLSPHLP
ncbi:MAG: phosphatase PAP2 family protein [Thermoanaerobaculum sp.]|nr:phosphatase PAP2 family protein [Thermoanaerobaculum sp.]